MRRGPAVLPRCNVSSSATPAGGIHGANVGKPQLRVADLAILMPDPRGTEASLAMSWLHRVTLLAPPSPLALGSYTLDSTTRGLLTLGLPPEQRDCTEKATTTRNV